MARNRMQAEIAVAESTVVIGGFAVTARRLWLRLVVLMQDATTSLPTEPALRS
jgi:hypothetical protein